MNCKYCDKLIPEDAVYCCYCGKKQVKAVTNRKRANGEGLIYKRGSSYTAMHTATRNGKRITHSKGGFKTKKDAQLWLNENNALRTEKTVAIPTFSQLYKDWSAIHYPTITRKKSVAYTASYNTMKDLHNLYYNEITLKQMQDAVNCAKNTYGQRRLCKNVLHMMEDYANKNGYDERHITQYIVLPPNVKPVKNPFTEEEIRRLESAWENGDKFAGVILIMIYTGMRHCELKLLLPENIHIEDGYLMGGQKTEEGRQGEIMIVDGIKPMMEMFTGTNPVAYSDTTFKKHFKECLERNGITDHNPHECRHTFATLLVNSGTQSLTLQQLMRHSSVQQTQTYVHQSREELHRAINDAMKKTSRKGGLK